MIQVIVQNVLIILGIVLGMGFLIFIHEFGHFIMAKRHGVRVEIFSIGFGPAILRRRRGETEYRFSIIPLGGYVKLAGELPSAERAPRPDELWGKSAWARMQIFAAGAVLNLLVAFPICILANLIGRPEEVPIAGQVGVPESYAGMRPGDRILSVAGEPVRNLQKYRMQVLRRKSGTKVPVRISRDGRERTIQVEVRNSNFHRVGPLQNRLARIEKDSILARAGVREGELLEEIRWTGKDGKEVVRRILTLGDAQEAFEEIAGQKVVFRVRPIDGEPRDVRIQVPTRIIYRFPEDRRLREPIVGGVEKGFPAHGILEEGDRILAIAGRPVRSFHDLKEALRGLANRRVKIRFERNGKTLEKEIRPVISSDGSGHLGIILKPTNVIADVREGSVYEALPRGARIERVGDKTGDLTINDLVGFEVKDPAKPLIVGLGGGKTVTLKPVRAEVADTEALGILGFGPAVRTLDYEEWGAWERITEGLWQPIGICMLTWDFLKKMVSGQESAENLAGPVGIFHLTYVSANVGGWGGLVWLLGLITVNLGVLNLLPLPLLDGGHIWILLVAEKIRGKPPSERFLAGFQWVGVALFLGLVVFVTKNDIQRLFDGF